jgi:hypothetical protein
MEKYDIAWMFFKKKKLKPSDKLIISLDPEIKQLYDEIKELAERKKASRKKGISIPSFSFTLNTPLQSRMAILGENDSQEKITLENDPIEQVLRCTNNTESGLIVHILHDDMELFPRHKIFLRKKGSAMEIPYGQMSRFEQELLTKKDSKIVINVEANTGQI